MKEGAASKPLSGVFAILLAAGQSTRMGHPKPLLPWAGTTLILYQIRALLEAGVEGVVVVLGHEPKQIAEQLKDLDNVTAVVNSRYQLGMSSSIVAGESAVPESARALVIQAVDHPRTAKLLGLLVRAHLAGPQLVTVPACDGRRGHPPILSSALRRELGSVSEEEHGLRAVMSRHRQETVEYQIDSQEIFFNVNTPDDYLRVLSHFSPGTA
jgi:molybdenum cofactor cytidylyltransferase